MFGMMKDLQGWCYQGENDSVIRSLQLLLPVDVRMKEFAAK